MTPTQAKIHIERIMYRSSVAVAGESAASYALIKLIPAGGGVGKPLSVNLALVLDVSGSMYEEDGTGINRLDRIKQAARAAIDKLKPEDTLAIVAFAHNAQVVLPATSLAQKAKIDDVIERIDQFDVDPGGTAMDEGITLGLSEVEKNAGPGTVSRVMVLTDGETSGEQQCKQLARTAGEKKVGLIAIGVGQDWNKNLIMELSSLSDGGGWGYIDVNDVKAAEQVFAEKIEEMVAAGFLSVEMHLRPKKDVKIKRVRRVVPDIAIMQMAEPEERHLMASLGTLEKDSSTGYILEMSLPKRPDGKFSICDIEITFDPGTGKRETTGSVPLEVTYAPTNGYVNALVAKHIDEVQLAVQNEALQQAIATNNAPRIEQIAKQIEEKGNQMGPRAAKKTMLARKVLDEMHSTGRVSKKTQLATEDAFRETE